MLERTKEKLEKAYSERIEKSYDTELMIEFLIEKCRINYRAAQFFVFNKEIQ